MGRPSKQDQAIKAAQVLLDAVIQLDREVQAAYYEMGRILTALKEDKLYDLLGYDSMHALIEEELSVTPSTAYGYIKLYKTMKEHGYKRDEAIDFVNEFGMTNVIMVLKSEPKKLGKRAMKTRIETLPNRQMTFWFTTDNEELIHEALEKAGGIYDEESGRWKNASEALIEMARMVLNGRRKKAA